MPLKSDFLMSPKLTSHSISQNPHDFLIELIRKKAFRDAVTFLAHALPQMHSVWWACRGLTKMGSAESGDNLRAVIDLAERWLNDANPAYLAAAFAAAEKAGLDRPAGCLGIAQRPSQIRRCLFGC